MGFSVKHYILIATIRKELHFDDSLFNF